MHWKLLLLELYDNDLLATQFPVSSWSVYNVSLPRETSTCYLIPQPVYFAFLTLILFYHCISYSKVSCISSAAVLIKRIFYVMFLYLICLLCMCGPSGAWLSWPGFNLCGPSGDWQQCLTWPGLNSCVVQVVTDSSAWHGLGSHCVVSVVPDNSDWHGLWPGFNSQTGWIICVSGF